MTNDCVIINDICYACHHHANWHWKRVIKAGCDWKGCNCAGFADEPPKTIVSRFVGGPFDNLPIYGSPTPLPAGRALDAEVATKVMGWTEWKSPVVPRGVDEPDCWRTGDPESPTRTIAYWSPSTDIAAAWLVLDWLRSQRDVVMLTFDTRDKCWEIDACDYIDDDTGKRDDGSAPRGCAVIVSAETAPLAICRAALAAIASRARLRELGS